MLETKTLKVANSAEESTISLMQQFGWSLLSSQDVNNTDSHLENRNGSIYSVTTSEKYVKLVFNRDKDMANYSQIVKLENEYYSIINSEPRVSAIDVKIALTGLVFFLIPGILYIVFMKKKIKKEENNHYEWKKKANKRIAEIMGETTILLSTKK